MSLSSLVGKTIADICASGYTDGAINHCAHFVSHYLDLQFGMTCSMLTGRGRVGANVRVQEVFRQCPEVGWLEDFARRDEVLVFVTAKSNVDLRTKTIRNVPKKHVGVYDGAHVYHYSNSRDVVVKQTLDAFKSTFARSYGGDLGFYYGTMPGRELFVAPSAAAALDLTTELRGREVYARIGTGAEFYVARRVSYGSRIGLMQRAADPAGPIYDPTGFDQEYGSWAWLVAVIGEGESANRFNRINSYDRAAFTFGFFQLAAHTPNDNLVLLLRRATELAAFQSAFPELQMRNGRLHHVAGTTLTDLEAETYNPTQNERELRGLMRYLNPNEHEVDEAEMRNAARLVELCRASDEFCALQVRTAIQITAGKFRDRYQHWYDLAGETDSVCVAIADVHHQGRGSKAQVRAALGRSNKLAALTSIGEARYPERCRALKAAINRLVAARKLGTHVYEPAHGVFVPQ